MFPKKPHRLRRRAGFSLVELLVIVAILALLAAIAATSYGRVKAMAGRMSCGSNLRNLGMAVQFYSADHQGQFPPYLERTSAGTRWYFGMETTQWTDGESHRDLSVNEGALGPYLEDAGGVVRCPSFNYGSAIWKPKYKTPSWGYGYNWVLGGGFGGRPMRMTDVDHPSRTVLFGDCAQVNTFQAPASASNPLLEEFYIISDEYPTVHFRHGGMANMLFVDGHIESFRPAEGSLDQRLPGAVLGKIDPNRLGTD